MFYEEEQTRIFLPDSTLNELSEGHALQGQSPEELQKNLLILQIRKAAGDIKEQTDCCPGQRVLVCGCTIR